MLCLVRWLTRFFESDLLQLAAVALDLEWINRIWSIILLFRLDRSLLAWFVNWRIASLRSKISHSVVVALLALRLYKADVIWTIDVTRVYEPICFNRVNLILNRIETLASTAWRLQFLSVSHLASNLLVGCLNLFIGGQRDANLRYFMNCTCVVCCLLFSYWLHGKVVLVGGRTDVALPKLVALSELIVPTFWIALVWPLRRVIGLFGLLLAKLAIKTLPKSSLMNYDLPLLVRCDCVSRFGHVSRYIRSFAFIVFQPLVLPISWFLDNLRPHDQLWWRCVVSELIIYYRRTGSSYRARVRQFLVDKFSVLLFKLERRNKELVATIGKLRTFYKLLVFWFYNCSWLCKRSSAPILLPWLVRSTQSLLFWVFSFYWILVSLRAAWSILWVVRLVAIFDGHLLDV